MSERVSEERKEEFVCCICGCKLEGYGNNPEPVQHFGRCCNECTATQVIPARMVRLSAIKGWRTR